MAANAQVVEVVYKVRQQKVMVVALPEFGHLMPVLHIATALARRQHDVQLVSCAFVAEEVRAQCEESGVRFVGICEDVQSPDGGSGENVELMKAKKPLEAYIWYNTRMLAPLRALIEEAKPDVIVTDVFTICTGQVARGGKAALVMNVPGPLNMAPIWRLPIARILVPIIAPVVLSLACDQLPHLRSLLNVCCPMLYENLCLMNSFWGIHKPMALPPNLIVTGPTAPRPTGVVVETSLQALNGWLKEVRRNNLKIVYVTMGSIVALEKWQVEGIYNGLLPLGCAVIWALKDAQQELLPVPQDDVPARFFIHKWLPQAQALQLKEVAVVVTHCGWGGFMETVAAGKPLVATPFLGDQPGNADIALQNGMGELLPPKRLQANYVQDVVGKVLNNPQYAAKAVEAQRALLASGGVTKCCEVVEEVSIHGSKYSTSPAPSPGCECFKLLLGLLVLLAVLGAVVFFGGRLVGGESAAVATLTIPTPVAPVRVLI